MFKKLLVPLDGTAQSAAALPLARAVARATGARLTLLRVVPAGESKKRALSDAQHDLARIVAELAAGGLTAEAIVRMGEPAEEILEQARTEGADLTVMRTHGRAGLARAVFGSVAEHVLSHSPVPLLVLRPGGKRVSHIRSLLVPVDGSPGGALALGSAVGLAQATSASVHLLEVVVPIAFYLYEATAYNGTSYVDPAWDDEARKSAQMYVDSIAARLRRGGLTVEGEIYTARSIANTITDVAANRGTDIIVMSTDALTGPARAVLGSVADAVVRRARCPVLLVRREAPTAQHAVTPGTDIRSREPGLIPGDT